MLIQGQFSASTAILFQNGGHLNTSNSNKNHIYEPISMKLAIHKVITTCSSMVKFKPQRPIFFQNGGHLNISNSNKNCIYEPN